ncbi:MAG: hypothetical protein AB1679_29855 [Actinomycetota bacterium]|jgi:hypothetical protein
MDVLTSFLSDGPVRAVPPAVAAGERVPDAPKVTSGVRDVGVEFSQRSDGVQVVTFIDRRTGVVISQTPPAQVLAVVDALMAKIQGREG